MAVCKSQNRRTHFDAAELMRELLLYVCRPRWSTADAAHRAVCKVQSVEIPCTDVDVILGTDLGPVGGESGGPETNHRHEQKGRNNDTHD